jgi:hypothetical protein
VLNVLDTLPGDGDQSLEHLQELVPGANPLLQGAHQQVAFLKKNCEKSVKIYKKIE